MKFYIPMLNVLLILSACTNTSNLDLIELETIP